MRPLSQLPDKWDFCVIVSTSPLLHDSRIHRLSHFFAEQLGGGQVTTLGLADSARPLIPKLAGRTVLARRYLPQIRRGGLRAILSSAGLSLEVLRTYLRTVRSGGRGLVWSVDADGLLFGWALSRSLGATLIYDAHEFWPYEATRRGLGGWLLGLERRLILKAQRVVTVSQSMARQYRQHYGLIRDPLVLFNYPQVSTSQAVLDLHSPGLFTLLYQGHLVEDRGLLDFVRIFRKVKGELPLRLAFLGFGPLYQALAAQAGPDLMVLPPVAPADLVAVTATASAGLVLLDRRNLNHCLTLCNKFFEYLAAGIPVLASDCCAEMNSLVGAHRLGLTLDTTDENEVRRALQLLMDRQPGLDPQAQQQFAWEVQMCKLRKDLLDLARAA